MSFVFLPWGHRSPQLYGLYPENWCFVILLNWHFRKDGNSVLLLGQGWSGSSPALPILPKLLKISSFAQYGIKLVYLWIVANNTEKWFDVNVCAFSNISPNTKQKPFLKQDLSIKQRKAHLSSGTVSIFGERWVLALQFLLQHWGK